MPGSPNSSSTAEPPSLWPSTCALPASIHSLSSAATASSVSLEAEYSDLRTWLDPVLPTWSCLVALQEAEHADAQTTLGLTGVLSARSALNWP